MAKSEWWLLRAQDLSISDISTLVISDVRDADKRIEKMFDWRMSREMEIAKWVLGLAATIAAAFLIAAFKAEVHPNWWQTCLLAAIPLITALVGLAQLYRAKHVEKQFLSALQIEAKLTQIRPFLIRYRQAKR